MSIKDMPREELELLSYKDMTNLLLMEDGQMNTGDIFKQIIKLLDLPKNTFDQKIGDFYTSLTTDKRFVLLDGKWDLRSRHTSDKVVIKIDEEDDDLEEVQDDSDEENDSESEDENFDATEDDDEYDDSDDELKDYVVIDEDEMELEQ